MTQLSFVYVKVKQTLLFHFKLILSIAVTESLKKVM